MLLLIIQQQDDAALLRYWEEEAKYELEAERRNEEALSGYGYDYEAQLDIEMHPDDPQVNLSDDFWQD